MTVKEAARRLGVTRPNLSRKLNGRAGISAVMSVRLAKAMPYTSPEFWLKLQLNYDLSKAQKSRQPKNQTVSGPAAKGACLRPVFPALRSGLKVSPYTFPSLSSFDIKPLQGD